MTDLEDEKVFSVDVDAKFLQFLEVDGRADDFVVDPVLGSRADDGAGELLLHVFTHRKDGANSSAIRNLETKTKVEQC